MNWKLASLLFGIAVLAAISTNAEARDGCGRGLYYNGYRCVPEQYGPPPGQQLQFNLGGGRSEPQYYPPSRRYSGNGCPPRYTVQDGLCKPYRGY